MPAVKFRGQEVEVEVDHDEGYDPDTGSHDIEWHFADMTFEEVEALKVTDAESESIYQQLVEFSRDDEGSDLELDGWE
jgi:hypothetical protein